MFARDESCRPERALTSPLRAAPEACAAPTPERLVLVGGRRGSEVCVGVCSRARAAARGIQSSASCAVAATTTPRAASAQRRRQLSRRQSPRDQAGRPRRQSPILVAVPLPLPSVSAARARSLIPGPYRGVAVETKHHYPELFGKQAFRAAWLAGLFGFPCPCISTLTPAPWPESSAGIPCSRMHFANLRIASS